jgi:bacteriocin-like protein
MEKTDPFEKLRQAIGNSAAYQDRLKTTESQEEAVSALLDIADAEGIALQRAELERQIEEARSNMGELSENELESVSGGYNFNGPNSWVQLIPRDPTYGGRLKPL